MALFCAMSGSTANTCSATALRSVGRIALIFYVKGNSDPKVVSVLLSWLGLRVTLNGEVCTVDFSVALRAVVSLGIWTVFRSSAFAGQVLLEEFGRFFGSPR